MPRTANRRHTYKTAPAHGLKAVAGQAGTYEAVVAVFGNVDLIGDKILPGAFEASLDRWAASGDPVPVIFAHQWDDLRSHLGVVLEAKELAAGDRRLPPEIAGLGGLYVKMKLDVDAAPEESHAPRVAELLARRSLKEFSFAYDVIDGARTDDGIHELRELDLIEVGPCLKGMNPATALLSRPLLSAKAVAAIEDDLVSGVLTLLRGIGADDLAAFVEDCAAALDGSAGEPDDAGSVDDDGDDPEGNGEDPDGDADEGNPEDPTGSDTGTTGEAARLAAELDLIEL
jgi:HK97 family phage prohead protease